MPDLFDSREIPLATQIEYVERECRQRIRVYARLVADGKMTKAKSSAELAAMQAVLSTLQKLHASENAVPKADEPCLTRAEQRAQGARCNCRGSDDNCPCQNVPDDVTRRERVAQKVKP